MAKRIECYIHSDSTTANKGGAMIELICQTDFCAKTEQFIDFAHGVAIAAYGSQKTIWTEIIEIFPQLEEERKKVCEELGEEISLGDVAILPKYCSKVGKNRIED